MALHCHRKPPPIARFSQLRLACVPKHHLYTHSVNRHGKSHIEVLMARSTRMTSINSTQDNLFPHATTAVFAIVLLSLHCTIPPTYFRSILNAGAEASGFKEKRIQIIHQWMLRLQ